MTQKADIENELVTLRIANRHRYTQEQIVAWLKVFTRGELHDPEFQRRIIDVFINTVFVYDDKLVIYYNIKDCKQVSYIEMLDSTEEPPFGGDPDLCNGTHSAGEEGFVYQITSPAISSTIVDTINSVHKSGRDLCFYEVAVRLSGVVEGFVFDIA